LVDAVVAKLRSQGRVVGVAAAEDGRVVDDVLGQTVGDVRLDRLVEITNDLSLAIVDKVSCQLQAHTAHAHAA